MKPTWHEFVDAAPDGWWWHTKMWADYQVAHAGSTGVCVTVDDGLCPLFFRDGECEMEGEPGPWPLAENPEAMERLLAEVERVARHVGVPRLRFRASPLVLWSAPLPGEGWRDISWVSRVLDLTQSEARLHAGVRKSYRHLINRGRQTWEGWNCAGNPEAFHVLWGEVNGHRRHAEAEVLMSEWLKTGNARLFGAWRGGRWEAFCYVIVYKRRAYYASGPSLVPGAMHALQWDMILGLKTEGVELYELGWQARPGDSEKDRGIARFKAGFGGEDRIVRAVEREFKEADDAH